MARRQNTGAQLDVALRREMSARAQRALQIYRRYPRTYDDAGYPFAKRPEDGSVRDTGAARVRPIPGGVEISVTARGAKFEEFGNDSGGSKEFITGELRLPLKGASQRGARGRVTIIDGKPYLAVQRVHTYRGRYLLRKSISAAFTGRAARF